MLCDPRAAEEAEFVAVYPINKNTKITAPKFSCKIKIVRRKVWATRNQAIVTILYVPGPPNFAGTIIRPIPVHKPGLLKTNTIQSVLERLLYFCAIFVVYSIHSGDLGYDIGLLNVKCRLCTNYLSLSMNERRSGLILSPKFTVPINKQHFLL